MFTEKDFVKKAPNLKGLSILYNSNGIYLIKVNNFSTCHTLFDRPTISWCIAQRISHWESYVSDPGNEQYFIIDFNNTEGKGEDYNYSLIGFTKDKNNIVAAHARNDDNLLVTDDGISLFDKHLKRIGLYDKVYGITKSDSMVPVYFLIFAIIACLCTIFIRCS